MSKQKVWIVYRFFLDLNTLEDETDWWIFKTEEKAQKAFEETLKEYYERFGKYREEDYAEYQVEERLVYLEVERHRFYLVCGEEPLF